MGSFSGSWWLVDACPIITYPLSICRCPSPSLCHHLRCLRKTHQFSAPEAKKERGDYEEMRLYSSLTLTFFLCLKFTVFGNFFSLISRVPCTYLNWGLVVPSVICQVNASGLRQQDAEQGHHHRDAPEDGQGDGSVVLVQGNDQRGQDPSHPRHG